MRPRPVQTAPPSALSARGLPSHRLGSSPDPDIHKHYQGIVRKHGPGTPYLFVSRSGNDVPECVTDCAPEPGNLVIIRMGSRDTNGERKGYALAAVLYAPDLSAYRAQEAERRLGCKAYLRPDHQHGDKNELPNRRFAEI